MITDPANRPLEVEAEYRRLVISQCDLMEADDFLGYLVAMGRHGPNEQAELSDLRCAWTIGAIVAYGRPFSKNYGAPTTAPRLLIENIPGLTSEALALHEITIDKRNKIFAHSDADSTALFYQFNHPNGPVPHTINPRVALSLEQAQALKDLTLIVRHWVGGRALEISGIPIMGWRRGAPGGS